MVFESFKEKDTKEFAYTLARKACKGAVFALEGDLGCGKTAFAAGFAKGLDIKTPISSPTFTILQIYGGGRLPLYHFDVYRIGSAPELDELGFDDYIYGDGVCLIEWPERVLEFLPKETRFIKIEKDLERGFDFRRIIYEDFSD